MRSLLKYVYTVIALTLLSASLDACITESDDRSAFQVIEGGDWAYGDTLHFSLRVDSLPTRGQIEVALRHTNEYPYSNIWLEVVSNDNRGLHNTDTVNIELCDMYGQWYGKGFGDSYQITSTLPVSFLPDTIITIGVRHIMRVDTLRGIDQVGVRIIPITGSDAGMNINSHL